jgi:hypothetical protein
VCVFFFFFNDVATSLNWLTGWRHSKYFDKDDLKCFEKVVFSLMRQTLYVLLFSIMQSNLKFCDEGDIDIDGRIILTFIPPEWIFKF